MNIKSLDGQYCEQVEDIQARLIDLGSHVATPRKTEDDISEKKLAHTAFDEENVFKLERWIDHMETGLPPLKNFILPSGGLAASHIHLCKLLLTQFNISTYNLQES